jgi:DivIVA domain-containing protein
MRGWWPVARPGSDAPLVNGDEVGDTWFFSYRHSLSDYDAVEVDDLLRSVASELDAGRPAGALIENATFQRAGKSGYDVDGVDWFLDQLVRQPNDLDLAGLNSDPWRDLAVAQFAQIGVSDPARQRRNLRKYFAEECADAWRNFGQQPGIYLRWEGLKRASGLPAGNLS